MRARCNDSQKLANISVYCLEKYLTKDEVKETLKITDSATVEERIDRAVKWLIDLAVLRREAGKQLCMAFKQTNRETFFAEAEKRGLRKDFASILLQEVFTGTLQGVWDAKTEK